MADGQYVKLLLWREKDKRDKYVIALRATAEFYGWTKEFNEWTLPTAYADDRYEYSYVPVRKPSIHNEAGRRHQICRSPSTAGMPRGLTNQFKVSRNCGLLDLAELANFTEGDWHWMTSPYGERIRRDQWLAIHQKGIPGRRGVACSV